MTRTLSREFQRVAEFFAVLCQRLDDQGQIPCVSDPCRQLFHLRLGRNQAQIFRVGSAHGAQHETGEALDEAHPLAETLGEAEDLCVYAQVEARSRRAPCSAEKKRTWVAENLAQSRSFPGAERSDPTETVR